MPLMMFTSATDEAGAEHQVIRDVSLSFWIVMGVCLAVGFALFMVGQSKAEKADKAIKAAEDRLTAEFERRSGTADRPELRN